MTLAIFDLDNTLLAGDSDHAWGQFLVDEGYVDASHFKKKNDEFYEQYTLGSLNILDYLEFALQPLADHPMAQLHELRTKFISEVICPLIPEKSRALVAKHQAQGDILLIITATNLFVTELIAKELGIDHIIATEPEIIDGKYTGKVAGVPSFQEGKVIRLDKWLIEKNISLEGAYFYSDSHNDLPLLNKVDYPIVVDADPQLLAAAKANNWPIISLRG